VAASGLPAADVRGRVGHGRPARHEAVRRPGELQRREHVFEDPVLHGLEAPVRGADQALAAGLLGDREAVVVRRGREDRTFDRGSARESL
jgi:hypothetical protein